MTDRSQNGVRAERVLVVDDEEAIRTIIVSFLVAADYECREAASGLEALSLLSGDTFDLVLYDLMMPLHNFDGIGLLERTTKQYPD
ncbi:MAG: response regulator, partial [Candidatus Sulfotelmatobacter sp.]